MKRLIPMLLSALVIWLAASPLFADRGSMYYVSGGTVYRAELDGSNPVPLIQTFALDLALDESAGKMYITGDLPLGAPIPTGRIWIANLDGSGQETLVESWTRPMGVAIEPAGILSPAGAMYWTDAQGVHRASLQGADQQLLIKQAEQPSGIALNIREGFIYWSLSLVGPGGTAIRRARMDGSGLEDIVVGTEGATTCIAVDEKDGKVYFGYINPFIDSIYAASILRANLDGTGLEPVVSGLFRPGGIALDLEAGKLYWTDADPAGTGGSIHRANLDGSEVQWLAGLAFHPGGIALRSGVIPEPAAGSTLVAGCVALLLKRLRGR